ncbi:MAG TPA: FtsX-like permease family protein, partial [Vicinamibacterales bacterium]|nr:FtsX-like permease family protein [Vicinamibacterales bacterium]
TGDPLGRQVRVNRLASGPAPVADPTFQIVGVVPDTANQGLRDPSAPQVYVPFPVRGPIGLLFLVRTAGEPMAVAAGVRREIQTVDRRVAVNESISLEDVLQRSFFAQPRFTLIVLVMFAATGLVLVALGVYGVLAYTVSQRSREIAIRVALGGERRHVLGHIVGMGVRLLGAGVIVGLVVGFATNRLLASQLWQTSPHDPLTLAAVTMLVVTIGLCACWVPARRALGVQPIAALRHE